VTNDWQLVETALKSRPDVIQLRFERDAANKFARAEKDLNYPTISAFAAAGVVPLRNEALNPNYAAAGVNLKLPIFDGLLFSAREKEAQLKARVVEENLRDAENNVIRDVRIAALNLSYAAEQMTLTAQLLASANEAFDLAQARYKVGSSSIVELSQAQLNQTGAEIAQAKAKYEYQTRQSILNFQSGQLR
jgi:outer membrane protein